MKDTAMPRSTTETAQTARRPTNVTLPDALLHDARALKINLSQAAERGVAAAVKAEKERRWIEENRAAMDAYNARIEQDGLILARYRRF